MHLGTRGANFVRRRFGLGYWSLSAYAKKRVKDAVSFIGRFEEEIVRYVKKFSVDAVLCGHIHSAAVRRRYILQLRRLGRKLFGASRAPGWHDRDDKLPIRLVRVVPLSSESPSCFRRKNAWTNQLG